jgi:hypothetical protein
MPPRLAAFWEEFWKSFTWIGQTLDKWEKVQKTVGSAIAFFLVLTGITVAITDVADAIRPAVPWLFGFVAMYIAWKAGIAWYKTSGPIIWIGDLEFTSRDAGDRKNVAEIRVRNAGRDEIMAFVFVVDVQDNPGKRIDRVPTGEIIPWMGVTAELGAPMLLYGDKIAFARVFQIQRQDHGTVLSLCSGGSILLEKHAELLLTIRVDFHTPPRRAIGPAVDQPGGGEFLMSRFKTIIVSFDATLPEFVRITRK